MRVLPSVGHPVCVQLSLPQPLSSPWGGSSRLLDNLFYPPRCSSPARPMSTSIHSRALFWLFSLCTPTPGLTGPRGFYDELLPLPPDQPLTGHLLGRLDTSNSLVDEGNPSHHVPSGTCSSVAGH